MTVNLRVQSECGYHDLAIECNIKPWGAPENTGYQIDIDKIYMERNGRQRKLPDKLTDELSNSDTFLEKILREVV